ncbi:MAG TPA: hypothetical protein VHP36_06835 [Chitinispirillaceae bacterium]|nr:hypothetical protein [Chitinispirillaceae bacterium]
MQHFELSMAVCCLCALLVSTNFAQNKNFLLDDHYVSNDINYLGSKWFYYDDNAGVGETDRPQAAPSSKPSVIDVPYTEEERHAFGNPEDKYLIKNYTFTTDTGFDRNRFATMPFTYGDEYLATYNSAEYTQRPYVGMRTRLAAEGEYIDLTGAESVRFKARSRKQFLKVLFSVFTYDIELDSTYGYYRTEITVFPDEWQEYSIDFGDLEQPPWVPDNKKRAFDQTKVTALNWEISGDQNDGIDSDTFDLDDIYIVNFAPSLPLPEIPTLVSPLNGATDAVDNQKIVWNPSKLAKYYSIQFQEDSLFKTENIIDHIPDTELIVSNSLPGGTKFYWRIRAENSVGASSDWSSTWHFTTAYRTPAVPVLMTPKNGDFNIPVSTTLSWKPSLNSSTYDLEISKSSSFSPVDTSFSGLTATSLTVSFLKYQTNYYWRVRGVNPDSIGNWSAPGNFTTVIAPPSPPVLVSPINNAIDVPVITPLVWNKVTTATSYTVQLASDTAFSNQVINQSSITDTSFVKVAIINNLPAPVLLANTTYYWRVKAVNTTVSGEWSVVSSFKTAIALPGTPVLLSPLDNLVNQATSMKFVWTSVPGAMSYAIAFSLDSSFTQPLPHSRVTKDTSVTVIGLSNDTKYYWMVVAVNAGGTGPASAKRSITTIVALPAKVVLVTTASDTVKTLEMSVYWHPSSPKIKKYYIELATNANFTSAIIDSSTDTAKYLAGLTNNTRYWWRVRAANEAGSGEFSENESFIVVVPVSVRSPEKFGVMTLGAGNIKNGISYSLPVKCIVRVSIYDFKGSLIKKLSDREQRAGVYAMQLPGLACGVYYLKFAAGGFRYNSKLIITK